MLGGLALLGTITASVAAWLVQKVAEEDGAGQAATRHQVNELTEQVLALRQIIAERLDVPAESAPRPVLPTAIPVQPGNGSASRNGTGDTSSSRRS